MYITKKDLLEEKQLPTINNYNNCVCFIKTIVVPIVISFFFFCYLHVITES